MKIFKKRLRPYSTKNSLKFTETTQNVVQNFYLNFLGCFEQKKLLNFLQGHEIFQKLLNPYVQNKSLKFKKLSEMLLGMCINTFQVVSTKINVFKNFKFFELFCRVMKFFKNG